MAIRRPAEVFPPGEYLRDELEERGWTQADLAEIMGSPIGTVSEIITGKRSITPEMARRLSAALGTSAEFWLNLDSAYRLSKVRDDEGSAIGRRAKIYAKAPVKDMMRRGWIEPTDNVSVLEGQILRFYGIDDIDDEPLLPLHAARKATPYDRASTPAQTAWLFRVVQVARATVVPAYSPDKLGEAIDRLNALLHAPQELRHVPRILSEAGIKFVVVQPLPGSKIDGACLWVDDSPVVAMSLRFDRIDNFWFVLFHELAHVRQRVASIDVDLDNPSEEGWSDIERSANEMAQEWLIPAAKLKGFIARIAPLYSAAKIEAFAQTVRVHPGIVVGQLQHRRELSYSSFRKWMVPVRDLITPSALTDGWGAVLAV